MSVLRLSAPIRMRTTATAADLPDTTPALVRMLDWSTASNGCWTARIGLDSAGSVRRTDAGFEVTGWQGDLEGVFPTLDEAQLSLEPAVRAAERDREEAAARRASVLSSFTFLAGATAAATAVLGWLLVLPL